MSDPRCADFQSLNYTPSFIRRFCHRTLLPQSRMTESEFAPIGCLNWSFVEVVTRFHLVIGTVVSSAPLNSLFPLYSGKTITGVHCVTENIHNRCNGVVMHIMCVYDRTLTLTYQRQLACLNAFLL